MTTLAAPHTQTPNEYGTALEADLRSSPAVRFAGLVAGGIYYYLKSGDYLRGSTTQRILVTVTRVTPSGRKADFAVWPDQSKMEATATQFSGDFHAVTQAQAERAFVRHRDLVAQALASAAEIPAAVRRHYPEMFVALPDGVQADELATLLTGWRSLTSRDDILGCIERTHDSIRGHDRAAAMLAVRGHRTQEELDKARNELLSRLALYTWLDPLVSPGGVFAVPPVKE